MSISTILRAAAVCMAVAAVCSCTVANAQSSKTLVGVDGVPVSASAANNARLKSLTSELHPGIYFRDGKAGVQEKAATTLFTDLASLEVLHSADIQRSSIEMVTIELTDASELTQQIDLAPFNSYPALKYVQVKASFPGTTEALFGMLKNAGGPYKILLNVDPIN